MKYLIDKIVGKNMRAATKLNQSMIIIFLNCKYLNDVR